MYLTGVSKEPLVLRIHRREAKVEAGSQVRRQLKESKQISK